jgi:hypothetical protein
MLQVSSAALTLLKEALEAEGEQDGHVFRLDINNDQFVLNLGEPQGDDIQYEHEGTTVLATPREVADELLGETTIDLENTDSGPKLVLLTEEA